MTLYRIDEGKAAEAFMDTVDGFPIAVKSLIQRGVLVEVKPVEMLVECPNRVDGDPQAGCGKCGGEGFVVARVVVVEDTE